MNDTCKHEFVNVSFDEVYCITCEYAPTKADLLNRLTTAEQQLAVSHANGAAWYEDFEKSQQELQQAREEINKKCIWEPCHDLYTACGEKAYELTKYCPHCGGKVELDTALEPNSE